MAGRIFSKGMTVSLKMKNTALQFLEDCEAVEKMLALMKQIEKAPGNDLERAQMDMDGFNKKLAEGNQSGSILIEDDAISIDGFRLSLHDRT